MSHHRIKTIHRAVALAMSVVLMASSVLGALSGCMPRSAYAEDGWEPMGFRTATRSLGPYANMGTYEAQDGTVAYCLNAESVGPSTVGAGFTLYNRGWSWVNDAYAAVTYHGYPNNTTIGGVTLSADEARAATQIAIYMLNGTCDRDGNYSYINYAGAHAQGYWGGTESKDRCIAAARYLYDGAQAGTLTAPVNTARRYNYVVSAAGNNRQNMLYVIYCPSVRVNFTKTSMQAELSNANSAYSLEGAVYEIHLASNDNLVGTITTDANGSASLELAPNENYYAIEITAPQGFVRNPDRIAFNSGSGASVSLPDQPGTVRVTLQKRDSSSGTEAQRGASLAGAEFKLVDAMGTSHLATTNEAGQAFFGDTDDDSIPLGPYTITEVTAPAGYRLSEEQISGTAQADAMNDAGIVMVEAAIDEHAIAFDLDITKYTDTGQEGSGVQTPGEGVVFEIISNTTNEVVGTIETDENGVATTAGMWFGAGERAEGVHGALPWDGAGYTVRETSDSAPPGYLPAPSWNIDANDIKDGVTLHYIVDNDLLQSRIQIVKADAETGDTIPLAGFTFQLLDHEKQPITQEVWHPEHQELNTFTTDENGTVTLPEPLTVGTYYIREIEAAAPYLTCGDDIEVIIEDRDDLPPVTVVTISDDAAVGRATITKTCREGDACATHFAGAEFDVIAVDDVISPTGATQAVAGEAIDHVVISEDGTAATANLPLGNGSATYAFRETKPPAGHVLDEELHEFTVTYEDDETPVVHASVTVENEPTELLVDKTILGSDTPLANATFELWNAEDEVSIRSEDGCAGVAIRAEDAGEVSLVQQVDEALVAATLPAGWSAVLVAGQDRWALTETPCAVEPGAYTLSVIDADGTTVEIDTGDALEVEAGMSYNVAGDEGLLASGSAHIDAASVDAKQQALAVNDELGAWISTAVTPGSWHVVTDGQECGTLEVHDGDVWYGMISEGTVVESGYLLQPGAEHTSHTTDEDGIIRIDHIVPGSYGLREIDAPDGYLVDDTTHRFTVDAQGKIEGLPSYTLDIEDDYTKVDLSKRDITNEDEIPGAHMALLDHEGTILATWASGEEDHRIDALAPGAYTLVETMTPHGYDVATAVDFTVHPTGEVQRVVMYDEPIEVSGEVDKRQEICDPVHPGTEANGDGANKAETAISDTGTYRYSIDMRNTSSTWVDEFTVTDTIDGAAGGLVTLDSITTPAAAEDYDGKLNVWFSTNETDAAYRDPAGANATLGDGHENPWLTHESIAERLGDDGRAVSYDGWRLWAQDVDATTPTTLDVADLDLGDGEVVCAVRLEYGRVEAGFTSRADDWDRLNIKDEHDDVNDLVAYADARRNDDGDVLFAPLLLALHATDAYQAGTSLENQAQVDLFRNGGSTEDGERLEDHDQDRVVQTPAPGASPRLDQTGRDELAPALLVAGTGAAGIAGVLWLRTTKQRILPRRSSRRHT